jgi:hypothetical protein
VPNSNKSLRKPKKKPDLSASISQPAAITSDGIPVWCHHDELCDPTTLPDYPGNPNTHGEEQCRRIVAIITANGWREAITRSRLSGRITKGHGRKLAAILAQWRAVPVVWQDYATEEDERRDVIADNRAREGSEMDAEALTAMLGETPGEGSGFSEDETRELLDEAKEPVKPEVKFAEWLDETNNYVVLQFRNDIDWIAAMTHFQIETVANKRSTGKEWGRGIGRVIDGAKYLERIHKE